MSRNLLPIILSACGLISAQAAVTILNFGSPVYDSGNKINNYTTPDKSLYNATSPGDLTTSLTGTSGAYGPNNIHYNTVQSFHDVSGIPQTIELTLHRTSSKASNESTNGSYSNAAAVSEVANFATISIADMDAMGASFVRPDISGSRIDPVILRNVHNGSASSYNVVLYFAFTTSAIPGEPLTSVRVNGSTNGLSFAGSGGSGFDSPTLAGSDPDPSELTYVKWTGTLAANEPSLTIKTSGNKAGIAFVVYNVTPIPEPTVALLGGLGLLGILRRRRGFSL